MNRLLYTTLVVMSLLTLTQCRNSTNDSSCLKVIIDTDMIHGFDDGIAFTMLLASDDVSVLGMTTVTGNSWAQEGLAYGMRQAEPFGDKGIVFIPGAQYPLREGRLDTLGDEIRVNPGMEAGWLGAISRPEIRNWRQFYHDTYGEDPLFEASDVDASEFIARRIMDNPGKVTLLAIGPCTNIARAIRRHPEIASMTKEIVYMGGAVFCDGNSTPYAELNFLYDPEAAAICLRAPFPRQTLVSLDVCNTVTMDRDTFNGIYDVIRNDVMRDNFRRQHNYAMFMEHPDARILVWDVISAAILLRPEVVTESRDVRIDVDDTPSSPTYGESFVTTDPDRQVVRVPMRVDAERIFAMIREAMGKPVE